MAVYVSNLVINTGTTFEQTFTLEGSDSSTPIDLTDYTFESQMRKHPGSSSATEFSVVIINPPTAGRLLIGLTTSQTYSLKPGRYVYDVLATNTIENKTSRVIEGMVLVREGVTK
jgi:hypothetical protein